MSLQTKKKKGQSSLIAENGFILSLRSVAKMPGAATISAPNSEGQKVYRNRIKGLYKVGVLTPNNGQGKKNVPAHPSSGVCKQWAKKERPSSSGKGWDISYGTPGARQSVAKRIERQQQKLNHYLVWTGETFGGRGEPPSSRGFKPGIHRKGVRY